jgi:hypothetical protein
MTVPGLTGRASDRAAADEAANAQGASQNVAQDANPNAKARQTISPEVSRMVLFFIALLRYSYGVPEF